MFGRGSLRTWLPVTGVVWTVPHMTRPDPAGGARNLIRELRDRCGEEISVRTAAGEVTGTLLSACVSGLWLICDGEDHLIGVSDVLSHRVIPAA